SMPRRGTWAETRFRVWPSQRNKPGPRIAIATPAGLCLARSSPMAQPTAPLHPDIETVLVTESAIRQRVQELGRDLKRSYGDDEITVIAIMNGAILFTADLLRQVDNAVRLDCIRTTSYGSSTESHGTPKIVHGLTLDIAGRHVLILDDILDTGKTLSLIPSMIRGLK